MTIPCCDDQTVVIKKKRDYPPKLGSVAELAANRNGKRQRSPLGLPACIDEFRNWHFVAVSCSKQTSCLVVTSERKLLSREIDAKFLDRLTAIIVYIYHNVVIPLVIRRFLTSRKRRNAHRNRKYAYGSTYQHDGQLPFSEGGCGGL